MNALIVDDWAMAPLNDMEGSLLVLGDEKSILIAPVLRNGRPDQGMPKPDLTEAQIRNIVAWLRLQDI